MRKNQEVSLWLSISILGALTLSPASVGQASPDAHPGTPSDWTHQHVIFSKPATAEQTRRVQQDPRYWQQIGRQSSSVPEAGARRVLDTELGRRPHGRSPIKNPGLDRDWAVDLGDGASIGAGNYPAKYSFDTSAANCSTDFVVYPTGLTGASGQASIVAYNNLYSGCNGLNLGTAANFAMLAATTITSTGNSVVTGGNIGISPGTSLTGFPPGVLTAPAVEHLGDAVAAQAEADANTAYTYYQGLTDAAPVATILDGLTLTPGLYSASTLSLSAGQTVTLNGSGTYIFQIGSTLTLAGTVELSGGATAGNVIWLVGSSATLDAGSVAIGDILAHASITLDSGASVTGRTIALTAAVTMIDNPVTTVDTVPSVYWAYDTSEGTILSSPVFSLDGTQLAFVQTDGSGFGDLVLLKWAASPTESVGSPDSLSAVGHSSYFGCSAPCMDTFPLRHLRGNDTDTNSSIFYDYSSDTAYVGDDKGVLHQFHPVFKGAPAEVTAGAWPVQVNPTNITPLASPVYDSGTGKVFVTDQGGFLYSVTSAGVVTTSGQLDYSFANDGGPGIVEGPVVNSTAGFVYVFAASDNTPGCSGGTAHYSAVYELSTTFVALDTGGEATVGCSTPSGSTPSPLYVGAFDSTYVNSTAPAATGHIYVCGNTGGSPILYQLDAAYDLLASGVAGPTIASTTTPCSPVTDIFNPNASPGPSEWIYASVSTGGVTTGCSTGCIYNFIAATRQPTTMYVAGQEVLDNNRHIEVVETGGVSSAVTNAVFNLQCSTAGATRTDGQVSWLCQTSATYGPILLPAWGTNHRYTTGAEIIDPNGNVELVTSIGGNGNSGSSTPAFSLTPGGTVTAVGTPATNTVTWENMGAVASASLPASGGASGLIIDNFLGAGTEAGASQIYFTTLSDQTCATSGGTGGCAVQASQSALQ
jgi:Ice-binding-like